MHSGSRIGPYEIAAPIGAGGMGEVFRARDTRLHRDVAVKVLPRNFVSDADRLRRFEQEAKTLATLNHPNVLTIHDAGVHEGVPYLVSELLEGKTLRQEMNGGALPIRKATDYSLQIAQGLAAAHSKGVIHRDLKPENIFVTKDGRVKILDFGLAKLRNPLPALRAHSPIGGERDETATVHIGPSVIANTTEPGMVLGTPAYMSPEQARGEPTDHRADIFAFGAVLYEMLSGTRAFRRDTSVASMNAVLNEEPMDLSGIDPNIPPELDRIVRRCLEKQPEQRFQSPHDLAFSIENVRASSSNPHLPRTAAHPHLSLKRLLPWAVAMLAIAAALGAFLSGRRDASTLKADNGNAKASSSVRKLEIRIPIPLKQHTLPRLTGLAISPDGRKLAYANADGLWVRQLDQLIAPVLVSQAEKVTSPFWSPQSTDIAWFEDGSVKRAPVTGGRPMTICRFTIESGREALDGGAWLKSGEIIFATGFGGLYRVPAQGGNAELALPPAEGEIDFHDASSLPDGQGVIFAVHRKDKDHTPIDTIAVWNPKDGKSGKKILLHRPGSKLARPVVSSSGHVIFTDRNSFADENQWALPISLRTLKASGEPLRLTEGGFLPSVSTDGTLVMARQQAAASFLGPRQLVWVDRGGKISTPVGPVRKGLSFPRLSPDERSVILTAGEGPGPSRTWILDLTTGSALPLRPEGVAERNPYWFPNGQEIAVWSFRTNAIMGIIRGMEVGRPSRIIGQGQLLHLAPSGRFAFLRGIGRAAMTNYYVRLSEERSQPIPLPSESPNLVDARQLRPALSPDDATLAFQSDESDRSEIWAVAFPGFTNRVLVSRGGGIAPFWGRDGRELFYLSADGLAMMAASVVNQSGRQFGPPVKLFDLPTSILSGEQATRFTSLCDVSSDGQRFLMMQNVPDPTGPDPDLEPRVLLIQDWFEEYREKK